MNLEVKSSVILLSTLALGVALGVMGQGAIQRSRGGPDARVGPGTPGARQPGFVMHMKEILQLRADQDATVGPVLEATARVNRRVIDAARAELRIAVDSMSITLAPMLDEAQRQRLAEQTRKLHDPFRRPPPPPPDAPR